LWVFFISFFDNETSGFISICSYGVHFLFALLFEIYVRRFSCTLLGNGGALKKSLISAALIDRIGFETGA
jgi:hypothetical protein